MRIAHAFCEIVRAQHAVTSACVHTVHGIARCAECGQSGCRELYQSMLADAPAPLFLVRELCPKCSAHAFQSDASCHVLQAADKVNASALCLLATSKGRFLMVPRWSLSLTLSDSERVQALSEADDLLPGQVGLAIL